MNTTYKQFNESVLAVACQYGSVFYTLKNIDSDGYATLVSNSTGTEEKYYTKGRHLPEYPSIETLERYNIFLKQKEPLSTE